MEMAAAHGLAQRLAEMTGLDYINRNEVVEFLSEEDQIINSWFVASNQVFRKVDFFYILRRTLLFVMTNSPLKELKKKELLKVVSIYFNTFSNVLKNNMNIRKPVIDIILDPWKNIFFSWDELFQKKITLRDPNVQEYFRAEPEDVVMARVHVFLRQGKEDMAMTLARSSFFFHSRVAKHFSPKYQQYLNQNKNTSVGIKYKQGTASMDWYLYILQKRKNLPLIVNEMKQLNCHEGIMLIQRLRQNKKNESFAFTILQILFMHELVRSSKICCTKKIFYLWCLMHKEKNTSMDNILLEVRKTVATYAPSSAHFYLLVDALWNQFGSSFITVYVELYVRGLTVDINHLEAAKNGEIHEDVVYLECHIASMFAKLSTLFSDLHEGAARECMFSAFSLRPTKERLYILQSLTHSILSTENEMKMKSSLNGDLTSFQECKCVVKCSGLCKSTKEYFLEHPILMKGISNVPYAVVKDLVSVLEGVRCISFQYNLFDWRNNATDLGDYLKDYNLAKSWESDTEYGSEGSTKSDIEENPINDSLYQPSQIHIEPSHQSVKRKSESDNMKEIFTPNAGSDIELTNNVNKKIKVQEEVIANEMSKHNIFNVPGRTVSSFRTIGMEDAIENVIRMTLDCNRQKSNIPLNSCHNTSLNSSLNHANDGTKSLSLLSAHKPVAENHVYPYSLTNYGKTNNLNTSFKAANHLASVKSTIENTTKYPPSFTSKHSNLSQALTAPIVSRESVISPAMNKTKLISMQEQSYKQMAQNKLYSSKTSNASCYSMSNDDIKSAAVNPSNNVSLYHQEALNLDTKSNQYDQTRSTPNRITQTSQFISNQTLQVSKTVRRSSDMSAISEASKSHFSSNASVASSSSITSPVNLSQPKKTIAAQHAGYSSSSQSISKLSSMFRSDPRYVDNNNMGNTVVKRVEQSVTCFQDNNLVHCDRSSVIQHTMQHSGEGHVQPQPNNLEMPNQLSVSLNSNAVEQIRSVPRKEITNLPPFTVNVNDRAISNSSVAISANLVIPPRKPQTQIDLACQAISSSVTSVNNSETITIPGILASQSVIVSPWEQQRKNHGEYKYTKNINAVNLAPMDRRINKNRPPYEKQLALKPDPKGGRLKGPADKSADIQVFKSVTYPNHVRPTHPTLPSPNQSNSNASQIWSHVNNLSSQGVSQPTSSQPWYSEPYPKPNSGSNVSSKSSENLNRTVQQNISSVVKTLKLSKHTVDVSPHTIYSKPRLPNNSPVSSTSSYSPNSSVSSSASSSVLNNSSIYSSSNSNARTMSNENILHKDFTPHASSNLYSNRPNIKTYSGSNKVKKNSVELPEQQISSMQVTGDTVQYATPDVLQTSLLHSLVSHKDFSSCCSPSEVNPCQNCSLPAENNLMHSGEKNLDRHAEQMIPGLDKMIRDNYDVLTSSAPCDSPFSNKSSADERGHSTSSVNAAVINCQYCSHPFLTTELNRHILNSHSKELYAKDSFTSKIDSDGMGSENLCTKPLPLVPEQDSLFQKESFNSDLPHTKTFVNSVENQPSITEDDKNLDEIEAHAFSACMDLINNNKDLKRIVQGIDSFSQIDNNYLPFMPSNDSSNNFLNPNLCEEVQKAFASETPVQNSTYNDQNNEVNNFAKCEQPQLPEKVEVDKSLKCVFEFNEKEFDSPEPIQKLVHSKLQSSCSEKISTDTNKPPDELTFCALAEMIKVSISDNNILPAETSSRNIQKKIPIKIVKPQKINAEFNCPVCSKKVKSAWSLKRHMKLHSNLPSDSSEIITQTDVSPSTNIPDSTIQFENDIISHSRNSYNDSSDSMNPVLPPDIKTNHENSSTSEICGVLPKGRIKGIVKSPTVPCKICGKILTSVYMKKHIRKQHQENVKKAESSSSDVNMDVNLSSPTQVDSANVPILSPLLEQDIDSSTCLSMSDALKRNNPYTVADSSDFSAGNNRLPENTIKFNFNVLEFSKDSKVGTNKSTVDDTYLKSCQPLPENTSNSEGNNTNVDKSCKDKSKLLYKNLCHLCPKAYSTVSGLNRHLKSIHGIVFPRASRKNKIPNDSAAVEKKKKNKEMLQLQSDVRGNVNDSDIQNTRVSNININTHTIAQPAGSITASHAGANVDQITIERHKNLSPTINRSLLRAVLKSNFESKQREMMTPIKSTKVFPDKHYSSVNSEKTFACDTSENRDKQSSKEFYVTNNSSASNYECLGGLDPELKSNYKACTPVPSDSLPKTQSTESSKEYLCPVQPDTEVYNHSPSLPENSHLKELSEIDKNLQMKYTTHADSQNLSIQSNEISPISEIISNVSKCHFGGTSNNDDKEFFEDNSLKLLIPENKEESLSGNNDGSINESNEPKSIHQQEFVVRKDMNISEEFKFIKNKENIEESVMPELTLKEELEDNGILKKVENTPFKSRNIKNEEIQSESIEKVLEDYGNLPKEEDLDISDESDYSGSWVRVESDIAKHLQKQERDHNKSFENFDESVVRKNDYKRVELHQKPEMKEKEKHSESAQEICFENFEKGILEQAGNNMNFYNSGIIKNNESIYQCNEMKKEECEIVGKEENYGDFSNESVSENNKSIHVTHKKAVIHQQNLEKIENTRKEKKFSNNFDKSNLLCGRMLDKNVSNSVNNEKENFTNESCEIDTISDNLDENYTKCRFCDQNLSSMDSLSKHLKEVHDIPVLKKHISRPCSPELANCFQEPSKLSPPKLKLGTNESDSESISDFDNMQSANYSEQYTTQNGNDLCAILSPLTKQAGQDEETILQNSQSKLKVSNENSYLTEKEIELNQSDSSVLQSDTEKEIELNQDSSVLQSDTEKEIELNQDSSVLQSDTEKEIELNQSDSSVFQSATQDIELNESDSSMQPAAEKEIKLDQSDPFMFQPANHLNLYNRHEVRKSIVRRHSLCDIYSLSNRDLTPLVDKNDHLSIDFKGISFSHKKGKSISLQNLKFALHYKIPNRNITHTFSSPVVESKPDESSTGDSRTLSSVTEICTSRNSLSQNIPVQWPKLTIKSPFSLKSLYSNNSSKLSKRQKICQRKLYLSKLRTQSYTRNKKKIKKINGKDKRFSRHKKTKNTFKPIILTLKEATEISDFLKTHKQPIVKLIRLKEENNFYLPENQQNNSLPDLISNEYNVTETIINMENQKNNSTPNIISSEYNIKKAVVKLERMRIRSLPKVVIIKQNLVPNLLSENSNINSASVLSPENQSVSSPNDFYLDSQDTDTLQSDLSLMNENLPERSIEIATLSELDTNSNSSDSVQIIKTVTRDQKYSAKRRREFCTSPLTKKCFVVLKRI